MTLYKNILTAVVSLASMLACNCAFAEIIKGENPNSIYVCAYEKLISQSSQSKRIAKGKAELSALQEFFAYAVKENLVLPASLVHLSKDIKKSLINFSASSEIKGAEIIKSLILDDGRAVCVIEIPKSNLNNFKSLDFTKNPIQILNYISDATLLKLEISLVLKDENTMDILTNSSPLARGMQGRALNGISQVLIYPTNITKESIANMNTKALMDLVEGSIGLKDLQDLLLSEVKKRGYIKSAKFLAGYELPVKEVLPACKKFLVGLNKADLEYFVKFVAENNCALDFANIAIDNDSFNLAMKEFNGDKTDFKKCKNLILKSFLENLTDDAMNLLGRCYEEEGEFRQALICYFQTLSINPNQAYVKLNLAKSFYALNMEEEAVFWAKETISDNTSSAWSKGKAEELIEKIEPVQDLSNGDSI